MCELYASTAPHRYEVDRRSIRIQGVVTSLALENEIWSVLEVIAKQEQLSLAEFISTLYQEVIERHGEINNLASMLRVTCLTYLAHHKLAGVEKGSN
ncbi:ribbon-helix-helix domain-containing protein [Pseudoalteromonas sp. McH1-7]|uniref:ribbon-helix-helix domain-containing protein n=1 Tax=Pseudoalteromonas TaxID=53246 RepID=UPI00158FED6E|nr:MULTISPECIES: ribbon-helix-helix domain-containing protein [Pseudoalteromonas]MDW7549454.1 ribbon-helix-helix domain-containing protein [Pseudoalteromonas peptidolytica]NUZ10648.1 ribbon-helix-helix domain-containing protein [Pseudoalteromonas sp. McH1-7]USD29100.1 ribbon-helix-helix domain-containing protein [Pseudoalteromonas sp. SCSIO 43201]